MQHGVVIDHWLALNFGIGDCGFLGDEGLWNGTGPLGWRLRWRLRRRGGWDGSYRLG